MKNNKDILRASFDSLIGLKMRNLKLGYGSFLTMDFGKTIKTKLKTKKGIRTSERGEWHLWVYVCSWRINRAKTPFIGSSDSREIIESKLNEMGDQKLIKYKFLNSSLDVIIHFDNKFSLTIFNTNTQENEHWLLFTPNRYVLAAGPSNTISYKPASSA